MPQSVQPNPDALTQLGVINVNVFQVSLKRSEEHVVSLITSTPMRKTLKINAPLFTTKTNFLYSKTKLIKQLLSFAGLPVFLLLSLLFTQKPGFLTKRSTDGERKREREGGKGG